MKGFYIYLVAVDVLGFIQALPQVPPSIEAQTTALSPEDAIREEDAGRHDTLVSITSSSAAAGALSPTLASSSASSQISGYGDNKASKINGCIIFQPPRDESIQMCKNICGDAVAKQVQAGNTGSISCIAFNPPGYVPKDHEGSTTLTPGNCSCNEPLIDELADTYMNALPVIAEIGCQLLVTALQSVAEIAALAIPGVGEAIDGGMIAGISAAKLASYAYDAGSLGLGAFQSWANPCGGAGALPQDMQKVFNILQAANPLVIPKGGFKIPSKLPKGSGQTGNKDSGNDQPNNQEKPPDQRKPTKEPEPKPSDAGCRKQKRKPEDNCDEAKHVTSTLIAQGKSKANVETRKVTCTGKAHGQACFHYFSGVKNGMGEAKFSCTDDQAPARGGKVRATSNWKQAHNSGSEWNKYTTKEFLFQGAQSKASPQSPNCQADEWPPAYFRDQENYGQIVRYLPGSDNGGAGQLWKDWCKMNDGGKGNGQTLSGGSINPTLVKVGDRIASHTKIKQGTTTTVVSYNAEYTRAVFSMEFDWTGLPPDEVPDAKNDWGLRKNPCWPEAIVPDDPGWCLNLDDPWYDHNKQNPDLRPQYAKAPSDELKRAADAWLKAHDDHEIGNGEKGGTASKRPSSPGNSPDPKSRIGPNGGKSRGGSIQRRSVGVLDDSLVIRESNQTRKLTAEEIRRDVQIIRCKDRMCSREREEYDAGDVLIISGKIPTMTPSSNREATATMEFSATRLGESRVASARRRSHHLIPATMAP